MHMPYADPARQSAYQSEWAKRRRLKWIAEHGPCVDCETWDDLQVDHVDAKTKVTHRVWFWSQMRRDAELAKCAVRCEPCHKRKTAFNRENVTVKLSDHNPQAKLTVRQADVIRTSNLTNAQLARIYPVHPATISRIRRGKIRASETSGR